MKTYKIHFIRNGKTQANQDGRYVGRTDSSLSKEGREDLENFCMEKTYPYVDKVYSSPSTSCKETAGIIFPGKKITEIYQMQELDFGAFEGKTLEELKEDPDFEIWSRDSMNNAPPEGEDGVSFIERIIEGFDVIFQDMMDYSLGSVSVIVPVGIIMTSLALMGFPRKPMGEWECERGEGFTVIMTPELWMRDRIFEIIAEIPFNEKPDFLQKQYYEDGEEMFFE